MNLKRGAGVMAWWLRALAALPADLGPFPASRLSVFLFQGIDTLTQTHMQENINVPEINSKNIFQKRLF